MRKTDSTGSSLYQAHRHTSGVPSRDPHGGHDKQKQGFHNLGYSKSNDSTLKLEFDNNHVNQRLHAATSLARDGAVSPAEGGLYIIQPEPRWMDKGPSQVPVYPNIQEYEKEYGEQQQGAAKHGWDTSTMEGKSQSVDEIDEGVGGTPEYLCDTGDEGSILSVDIHTSTTSLSSAGTRDELTPAKTPDVSTLESGISVTKSEEEEEEVQSITDSMVAEALAALEAATAGEDFE